MSSQEVLVTIKSDPNKPDQEKKNVKDKKQENDKADPKKIKSEPKTKGQVKKPGINVVFQIAPISKNKGKDSLNTIIKQSNLSFQGKFLANNAERKKEFEELLSFFSSDQQKLKKTLRANIRSNKNHPLHQKLIKGKLFESDLNDYIKALQSDPRENEAQHLEEVDNKIREELRSYLKYRYILQTNEFNLKDARSQQLIQENPHCFVLSNPRLLSGCLSSIQSSILDHSEKTKTATLHMFRDGIPLYHSAATISLDKVSPFVSDYIDPDFADYEPNSNLIIQPSFSSVMNDMISNNEDGCKTIKRANIESKVRQERERYALTLELLDNRARKSAKRYEYFKGGITGMVLFSIGLYFTKYMPTIVVNDILGMTSIFSSWEIGDALFRQFARIECCSKESFDINLEKRFGEFDLYIIDDIWDPYNHNESTISNVRDEDNDHYVGIRPDFQGMILEKNMAQYNNLAADDHYYLVYIYRNGKRLKHSGYKLLESKIPGYALEFLSEKNRERKITDNKSYEDKPSQESTTVLQGIKTIFSDNKRDSDVVSNTSDNSDEIIYSARVQKPPRIVMPTKAEYKKKREEYQHQMEIRTNFLRMLELFDQYGREAVQDTFGWYGKRIVFCVFGTAGAVNLFIQSNALSLSLIIPTGLFMGYTAVGKVGNEAFNAGGYKKVCKKFGGYVARCCAILCCPITWPLGKLWRGLKWCGRQCRTKKITPVNNINQGSRSESPNLILNTSNSTAVTTSPLSGQHTDSSPKLANLKEKDSSPPQVKRDSITPGLGSSYNHPKAAFDDSQAKQLLDTNSLAVVTHSAPLNNSINQSKIHSINISNQESTQERRGSFSPMHDRAKNSGAQDKARPQSGVDHRLNLGKVNSPTKRTNSPMRNSNRVSKA